MKCCLYVNWEVGPQAKERNCADCLLDGENVKVQDRDILLPQNQADFPMGTTHLASSLEWGRGDEHWWVNGREVNGTARVRVSQVWIN